MIYGAAIGAIKGETWSLDHSSYGVSEFSGFLGLMGRF